jgi:hypothetical protein
MANIRLTTLLTEAKDFKARSKETGKLVHFKSKDSYDSALKAGTHEDPNAKKGEQPKAAAKSNSMFGADYAKDRGGVEPKNNQQKGILSTLGSVVRSAIFGEPTDDAKPEDKKETQPTKDDEKPKKPKKRKKPRHVDSTRRTTWKREPGAPYAEDDKFWADRFLAGDKLAGQIATEEEFNMYRSAKIQASLTDWFKAKDKKDFNYKISEPSENGYVRISF